ncbi:ABC transporter permease [Oryzibacter oryziterrae]|uniref:ABC transporter permease n=1 Tax=Oryzibacter oryziterrae TaxID=2766474 RepID=UPI001F000C7A|nr:ABC transporter permease [Oryzibacter oryziterrae]
MLQDVSIISALWKIISGGDGDFYSIILLSLEVTLTAVTLAGCVGLPLGAMLALTRFRGRLPIIVVINTLMGFPPVVAGLVVFLLLSRSGPLGGLGLLFTPQAMMTAQFILVLPIIVALTRQTVEDLWSEYADHMTSLGVGRIGSIPTLLWDARFSLVTTMLAGLGRASAEVGAILIVGGNIAGYTRTMTTSIALETSKGDLPLAMALGVVLITITLCINGLAYGVSRIGAKLAGGR